jgi:hypothetical protein
MSLDGGLEELLEFLPSLASRDSNSASRSRSSASSRSKTAHRGQPVVARSVMATPSYPNRLKLTKINSETVNGYWFWLNGYPRRRLCSCTCRRWQVDCWDDVVLTSSVAVFGEL